MLWNRTVRGLVASLGIVCLTTGAAAAAPVQLLRGAPSGDEPVSANLGGSVLFSTVGGIDPVEAFVVTSQDFLFTAPGFEDYETLNADDFTVTDNGWLLEAIEVRGSYFGLPAPGPISAASVNVYIVADAGGLPASADLPAGALFAWEGAPYTDVSDGDLRVTLPAPGWFLAPGTYWLVFQTSLDAMLGQWGWTESASAPASGTPTGNEAAWLQTPTEVLPNGCVGAWAQRVTVCGATTADNPPPEPDNAFLLEGSLGVPGIVVSPLTTETFEPDVTGSFDVVLEAPPSLGETVTVDLDDSAGAGLGTVSPVSLVFDGGNWDQPQTVTVNPVDDNTPGEDPVTWTVAVLPAVSGDPGYSGIDPSDVSVTHFDDDTVLSVPTVDVWGLLLLVGLLSLSGILTMRRPGS